MNDIRSIAASMGPAEVRVFSAVAERGAKAAREFEAQLIGNLLESMEKTFAALPGENSSAASDDYNYLGTRALSGALADRGGFGIAAMISRYLEAHESHQAVGSDRVG